MLHVHITSNIRPSRRSWLVAQKKFVRAVRSFLPRERPRIRKHTQEIVRVTVYDVYDPLYYKRTYNLLRSVRVYQPQPGNPYELWIDSNPAVATAVQKGRGGYAKFVAGEGPGIGFLKPYYGLSDSNRPSYFPRRFHDYIALMGSSIYSNLEADLTKRLLTRVVNKYL